VHRDWFDAWGHGYATEAARAVLHDGCTRLGLDEIVSFTATVNERSQRVMQRLGMHFSETFEHPRLPAGHRLRPHVLYRITCAEVARERP
jgi:RimJ/RimL family protein N-acetyltransferase